MVFTEELRRRAGWLISIAVFLTTVLVTPFSSLDPINVPKFWILQAFGFSILILLLSQSKVLISRSSWPVVISALAIVLFMIAALFASKAPLSQQLFGTNGRNTGLLTYLSFAVLFLGAALATNHNMAKTFVIATAGALGFNAIYGIIQALGSDPIKWSNPYSPVIGTFGNPNFVAAFLGMGFGFSLPFLIAKNTKPKFKLLSLAYLIGATFAMLRSDAQQGVIVSVIAAGLVIYFWLRSKTKNPVVRYGYLVLGLIGGVIGILGSLQKGPLTSILYKPSVTYRGDYWSAGIEMFKSHPFLGIGLDSYGDWYRAARTLAATERRGPSTVSNAAHNVFIDIAATAGIFALIAYLAVIVLGFRAMWKIMKRGSSFDPFVVAIFATWVGYLVQSVISINNIALGIWGWVLPGILIATERWITESENKTAPKSKSKATEFSSMFMVSGLVIGAVIGFIPFNADANFRHSVEKGDATAIYSSAEKWPKDSSRLIYAAKLFNENKMEDKGYALTKIATELNPRSFDAWNFLYQSKWSSEEEKKRAIENMKLLDPNNSEIAKLG